MCKVSFTNADGNRKGALIVLKVTKFNCFHLNHVSLNDVTILIMASWYFTGVDILWHQLSLVKFQKPIPYNDRLCVSVVTGVQRKWLLGPLYSLQAIFQ